jgi:hypothetical protein
MTISDIFSECIPTVRRTENFLVKGETVKFFYERLKYNSDFRMSSVTDKLLAGWSCLSQGLESWLSSLLE